MMPCLGAHLDNCSHYGVHPTMSGSYSGAQIDQSYHVQLHLGAHNSKEKDIRAYKGARAAIF